MGAKSEVDKSKGTHQAISDLEQRPVRRAPSPDLLSETRWQKNQDQGLIGLAEVAKTNPRQVKRGSRRGSPEGVSATCTCTSQELVSRSILAGWAVGAAAIGIALIPGVGQAVACGAVLSAKEAVIAGLLSGGTSMGYSSFMQNICNC